MCGLILLLDAGSKDTNPPVYTMYGLKLFSPRSLQSARDHVIGESVFFQGLPKGIKCESVFFHAGNQMQVMEAQLKVKLIETFGMT